MAVEILYDRTRQIACMYCNTEGRAFGPLFDDAQQAEDFVTWLRNSDVPWSVGSHVEGDGTDPRHYPPGELEEVVKWWRTLVEDGDAG